MNEVVKYHNDLNNINIGTFSESQLNILFTIFAKIKEKNMQEVKLSLPEITELANIQTSNKLQLNNTIFKTFKTMQSLTFRWKDDEAEGQSVAFYEILKKHNQNEIIIKVNPKFSYLFNNLMNNFTRFELEEFVSLEGKYTKTLYRLLKQYRKTGILKLEWDKFVNLMDIHNYSMRNIEKDILKPAVKKLSSEQTLFDQKRTPFKNLSYKKLKTPGLGNKITSIEFKFSTTLELAAPKSPPKQKPKINPLTGQEVSLSDEYSYITLYLKNNTLKIQSAHKQGEKIIVTLKNQDDGFTNEMEFDSMTKFKNFIKKYSY